MPSPTDQVPDFLINARLKLTVTTQDSTAANRIEILYLQLAGSVDYDGRVSVCPRYGQNQAELGSGASVTEAVIDALDHLARRLASKS